jgi:hypothetical protein
MTFGVIRINDYFTDFSYFIEKIWIKKSTGLTPL